MIYDLPSGWCKRSRIRNHNSINVARHVPLPYVILNEVKDLGNIHFGLRYTTEILRRKLLRMTNGKNLARHVPTSYIIHYTLYIIHKKHEKRTLAKNHPVRHHHPYGDSDHLGHHLVHRPDAMKAYPTKQCRSVPHGTLRHLSINFSTIK